MIDHIFFLTRIAFRHIFLLLLVLTEASLAKEGDSPNEFAIYSETQKHEARLSRFTLGLRYESNISLQMERHEIRSLAFDNSTKYALQFSAASSLKVTQETTLTGLLGIASIQKNIPFGSISLSHFIEKVIAIKPYIAITPLYTQIPLPNREQHLVKSSMGVSMNWHESYEWTTSLSREGQLAFVESHQISGSTEKIKFSNFNIKPRYLMQFDKSSKPNPFHFVPENLVYMTFFLPLTFSNFYLWVLEFSPNITYGQFQRHHHDYLQHFSAFQLNSSISTKDICKICLKFRIYYETTTLSDSSDYVDEDIQLLLSVSTRR